MEAFAKNANAGWQPGECADQNNTRANNTSNSAEAQRQRILSALHEHPVTTLFARQVLDVMHPAARVQELKADGHKIDTVWTHDQASSGGVHRVARYVLLSSPPSLFDAGD